MTRIKDCPEVTGKVSNEMIWVKTANGRTFIKKGVETSDEFTTAVIKKDIRIISGHCPKVHKVVDPKTEGAKVTADNKEAFLEVRIDELTDKDSYWTDLSSKNFEVTKEFLETMKVAELKAWATERGIKLKSKTRDDIINEILA